MLLTVLLALLHIVAGAVGDLLQVVIVVVAAVVVGDGGGVAVDADDAVAVDAVDALVAAKKN